MQLGKRSVGSILLGGFVLALGLLMAYTLTFEGQGRRERAGEADGRVVEHRADRRAGAGPPRPPRARAAAAGALGDLGRAARRLPGPDVPLLLEQPPRRGADGRLPQGPAQPVRAEAGGAGRRPARPV